MGKKTLELFVIIILCLLGIFMLQIGFVHPKKKVRYIFIPIGIIIIILSFFSLKHLPSNSENQSFVDKILQKK